MEIVEVIKPLTSGRIGEEAATILVAVFDGLGNKLDSTSLHRAMEAQSKGKGVLESTSPDCFVLKLNYIPSPTLADIEKNTETENAKWRRRRIAQLRERDRDFCFYCHATMVRDEMTLEHLLPKNLKASNSALNMVLAHKLCNEQAQDFSIAEKVRIRERNLIKILLGFNSDIDRQLFLLERDLRI